MSSRIVAIHQPNFFPWMGYFDKIYRADVFIFLDNVKFSRGSWSNRVKLLVNGVPRWLTCPVRRKSGLKVINQVLISENTDWRRKLWMTITQSYCQCRGWEENAPWLKELLVYSESGLAQYNVHAIKAISACLGISVEFVLGSELGEFEEKATDLLIAMTRRVGGAVYLSGDGTKGYQIDERFAQCGIGLLYQNFRHPVYEQPGTETFVPGLSIMDVILNCGVEGTSRLLEKASSEHT